MAFQMRALRQLAVLVILSKMCAAPDPSAMPSGFHLSDQADVKVAIKSFADSIMARVKHLKQGRLMLNPFTGYHRVGPSQKLAVTHPTEHETQRTVQWPVCVFGRAALLATFCVQATTPRMEKDPASLLPRVSLRVEPQKPSSATVFLIDGSDGSFQRAFPYAGIKNESAGCETVMRASTATIFPAADSGHAIGSRALRGSKPTKWYLVAVDCSKPRPACPNISQAVVTTYHPNAEAEPDSCTFGGSSALSALMSLQNLMSEVSELEMPDPLHMVGVGSFGVAVLYAVLFVMTASAFLFGTLSRVEPDETKKQVHLRSSFAVALMGLCYLSLATGNGLLILRKTGPSPTAGWVFSDTLAAAAFGSSPDLESLPGGKSEKGGRAQSGADTNRERISGASQVYPLLYIRYVGLLLSTPLLLQTLCALAGADRPARHMAHFLNLSIWTFLLVGACILGPAKWVFWVLACLAFGGLNFLVNRALWQQSQRKARPTRRLFQKLSLLLLGCWGVYPIIWIFIDGARAVNTDTAICVYGFLDIVSQCIFGMMLVRNVKEHPDFFSAREGSGRNGGGGVAAEEAQMMLRSEGEDA